MEILAFYAKNQEQADCFKEQFKEIGLDPIVRIVPDVRMLLPALRTTYNLYEGHKNVSRVISELKRRRA